MEFLWLSLRVIRGEQFVDADPVDRATWLCLLAHCADVENGGRIASCRGWKCRKWQQLCGVTAAEIGRTCGLWSWDGDDLIVHHYPLDKESQVRSARANGAKGGRPPKNHQDKPPGYTGSQPPAQTGSEPRAKQTRGEETRPDETREEKTRPDQNGRGGLGCRISGNGLGGGRKNGTPRGNPVDLDDLLAALRSQFGEPSDRLRAWAAEFLDEMREKGWSIDGQPLLNPIGCFINRARKSGLLPPKASP